MTELEELNNWYQENNCDHAHCPYDCEHPQPFLHEGKLICGRCAIICKTITEMVPCIPTVCKDK